jgi:hypothetical protein
MSYLRVLAREKDLEFRITWNDAAEMGMDRLVEESYRRVVEGAEEPVISGGRVVAICDPRSRPCVCRLSQKTLGAPFAPPTKGKSQAKRS